jgi:hypothetical protein
MFRRSAVACVSAFSLFMKESKALPALQGLPIPLRGKKLAELYKAQSASELAALKVRAATVTYARTPRNIKETQKRPPSAYNTFVKENINKFQGKSTDRIKHVAKLWRSTKK